MPAANGCFDLEHVDKLVDRSDSTHKGITFKNTTIDMIIKSIKS